MEPGSLLERGRRTLLRRVGGDQGGVQIDDHPPGQQLARHRQPRKPLWAAGEQRPYVSADLRSGLADPLQRLVEAGQRSPDGRLRRRITERPSPDGRVPRCRTYSWRRGRSRPRATPEPCRDPTSQGPCREAAPCSNRWSDRSDLHICAAGPHPRDRPGLSRPRRRPAADPTRHPYSPGGLFKTSSLPLAVTMINLWCVATCDGGRRPVDHLGCVDREDHLRPAAAQ